MRGLARTVTFGLALAGCHASPAPAATPRTGDITGITWDRTTGYAIAGAQIRAERAGALPVLAISAPGGLFDLDALAPGVYTLRGEYAHQTVELPGVDVTAGEATFAKLPFASPGSAAGSASGSGSDQPTILTTTSLAEIVRYHRPELGGAGRIEGFVIEANTHAVVTGAIVMATHAGDASGTAEQTASDDHGEFHIAPVAPGIYVVSAYYSIANRGQIEVRRSDVEVAAGDVVVVPMLVDTTR